MAKIAIIEDDMAIVQMYRMKFESLGYEVQTAGDGEAGVELVKNFRPDIVLLDLMMPKMTGDEALTEIRKLPDGKDLKVIMLTNTSQSEAPATIHENGVHQFIVKAEKTPREVADLVKAELAS